MSKQSLMQAFETMVDPEFYDGNSCAGCLVAQVEERSPVVNKFKFDNGIGADMTWGDEPEVVALAYEVEEHLVETIYERASEFEDDLPASLAMAREVLELEEEPV